MIEKNVEISNPSGLQARMGALFVQTAGKFTSSIWVAKDEKKVNGKSIMGILSLGIGNGTSITIGADGDDEVKAVEELIGLIQSNFNE